MSKHETSRVLNELLDANRGFALGARGTTNHCPMALVALARMGAAPQRLRAFFKRWEHEFALPAAPIGTPVPRTAWPQQVGRLAQFEAVQNCLQQWISQVGAQTVMLEVLQKIGFAPASGAFHALIRLAYGLEAQHTGEIAAGLAFLITRNLDIAMSLDQRQMCTTASAALAHLSKAMNGSVYAGDSIVSKLRMVVADPRFDSALPAVAPTQEIFAEMAGLAITAYWQTRNFTILHMVTGMHAARVVFAELPPELMPSLLPPLWIAFCAAYVSAGAPALPALEFHSKPVHSEPWPSLLAAAQLSNNEHVIKFSYSCHQENLAYANPLYFAAVSRLLKE